MAPETTTIDALIDRHAVLLLDAFGVLVSLEGALPGAAALITRLNRSVKPYWVLTNGASRLPQTMARHFAEQGLVVAAERIITSGQLIAAYFQVHGLAGAACAVLGPADSEAYVIQAGGRPVPARADFDVLVLCDEEGVAFPDALDAAFSSLVRRLDRGGTVHLVLPNPDLVYPRAAGTFGFTAGSLALMFEAALAQRYPRRRALRFQPLGKPHAPIFEEALRRSGTRDMVMLGDTLETDIAGARAFGLASALLLNGVSGPDAVDPVAAAGPTYRLANLLPQR